MKNNILNKNLDINTDFYELLIELFCLLPIYKTILLSSKYTIDYNLSQSLHANLYDIYTLVFFDKYSKEFIKNNKFILPNKNDNYKLSIHNICNNIFFERRHEVGKHTNLIIHGREEEIIYIQKELDYFNKKLQENKIYYNNDYYDIEKLPSLPFID